MTVPGPKLSGLAAATRNRCPVCGEGRLTHGFLTPEPRCSVCETDFTEHAAGDGAVYIVMTVACFVVMAIVLAIEFTLRPPIWVSVALGSAATFALIAALLPVAKRFMIAQSIVMDARTQRDGAL